jgi:hypothetical protein
VGQQPEPDAFLSFADVALDRTVERLPETDRSAMAMVLLLYRVSSTVVYDLESTVHRPAGWSWSALRLLFTLWVAGPQEASRAAELTREQGYDYFRLVRRDTDAERRISGTTGFRSLFDVQQFWKFVMLPGIDKLKKCLPDGFFYINFQFIFV